MRRLVAICVALALSACGGLLAPSEDAGPADVGRADAPDYGPPCEFDTLVEAAARDCGPLVAPWRCAVYYAPEGGCAWRGSPRFLVRSCDLCPWPLDAAAAERAVR